VSSSAADGVIIFSVVGGLVYLQSRKFRWKQLMPMRWAAAIELFHRYQAQL